MSVGYFLTGNSRNLGKTLTAKFLWQARPLILELSQKKKKKKKKKKNVLY